MEQKKRIIAVVNKYWECDPVCWVLTNKYIDDNGQCAIDLKQEQTMSLITYPSYGPVKQKKAKASLPRIVLETGSRVIEVWCISDLLSNSSADDQSSSEEKMKLMPIIFDYNYQNIKREVELVIAVGTASAGPGLALNQKIKGDNINGSVVIGSKVFLHNGGDKDSRSKFNCNCWRQVLSSSAGGFLSRLQQDDLSPFETLLLCPPTNPSPLKQHFYIDGQYVALADVNVTDYTKYAEKDKQTGDEYLSVANEKENGLSLETTHGLIYLSAKNYMNNQTPPFIFISGVVDRFTEFSTDVNPKIYAQNVSGAHNAGVATAYVLSRLTAGMDV